MARTEIDQAFACPFCESTLNRTEWTRGTFPNMTAAVRCDYCHARGPTADDAIGALRAWAVVNGRLNRK